MRRKAGENRSHDRQIGLLDCFPLADAAELQWGGTRLAANGSIYAADYDKPTAVAHMVQEACAARPGRRVSVHFFDDAVSNCHRVATETPKHESADVEVGDFRGMPTANAEG